MQAAEHRSGSNPRDTATAILNVENLSSGYSSVEVVRNVSLRIEAGEVVLLTGHNGAGKSCLVETIFGLVAPHSGSVYWNGEEVTGVRPRGMLSRGVVLVPQGGGIVRNLTVWENLQLVAPALLRNYESRSAGPHRDATLAVLDRLPILFERRNQISGALSGGQQRLLAIVRGLLLRPRLMIVDEPFLGLSGSSGDLVLDLFDHLLALGGDFSVIVVEQQLFRLTGRLDRYYVMRQGHVERQGEGDELWRLDPEELWSLS